jgi:hypothetical protein
VCASQPVIDADALARDARSVRRCAERSDLASSVETRA